MGNNSEVKKLNKAVDILWLRMAQCYAAFVVVMLFSLVADRWLYTNITELALPIALLCLAPWVLQAIHVRHCIKRVKDKSDE